jgi:hypothetical protein
MYDLKLTHSSLRLDRAIRTGDLVTQEGIVMLSVLQSGVEVTAVPNAGDVAASGLVLGFATTGDSLPSRTSACEDVTVPIAPASLITDVRNVNLVQNFIRIQRVDNNVVLTPDYTYAGSPAGGTVKIDVVHGAFKFNAAEAGVAIRITYLYDLTTLQAKQRFGQRNINNQNLHADFGRVEVLTGIGEIYTDQFDASVDWSNGNPITVGVGGVLNQGGAITVPATVVSVPNESLPLLGLRFSISA